MYLVATPVLDHQVTNNSDSRITFIHILDHQITCSATILDPQANNNSYSRSLCAFKQVPVYILELVIIYMPEP